MSEIKISINDKQLMTLKISVQTRINFLQNVIATTTKNTDDYWRVELSEAEDILEKLLDN